MLCWIKASEWYKSYRLWKVALMKNQWKWNQNPTLTIILGNSSCCNSQNATFVLNAFCSELQRLLHFTSKFCTVCIWMGCFWHPINMTSLWWSFTPLCLFVSFKSVAGLADADVVVEDLASASWPVAGRVWSRKGTFRPPPLLVKVASAQQGEAWTSWKW